MQMMRVFLPFMTESWMHWRILSNQQTESHFLLHIGSSMTLERYEKLKKEYDNACAVISEKDAKYEQMGRFITVLNDQSEFISEFDEALWGSLVEKIVVKSKDDVMVVFKDGTEIKAV